MSRLALSLAFLLGSAVVLPAPAVGQTPCASCQGDGPPATVLGEVSTSGDATILTLDTKLCVSCDLVGEGAMIGEIQLVPSKDLRLPSSGRYRVTGVLSPGETRHGQAGVGILVSELAPAPASAPPPSPAAPNATPGHEGVRSAGKDPAPVAEPYGLVARLGQTFRFRVEAAWPDGEGGSARQDLTVSLRVTKVEKHESVTLVQLAPVGHDRIFPESSVCRATLLETRWVAVSRAGMWNLGASKPNRRDLRSALALPPDWPTTAPSGECEPAMVAVDTAGDGNGNFSPTTREPGKPGTRTIDGAASVCRCEQTPGFEHIDIEECAVPFVGFVYLRESVEWPGEGDCTCSATLVGPEPTTSPKSDALP